MKKWFFTLLFIIICLFMSNSALAKSSVNLPVVNTYVSGNANHLLISSDSKYAFTAGNSQAYIWRLNGGQSKEIVDLSYQFVRDAAFSPDGQQLVVSAGAPYSSLSSQLVFYDSQSGNETKKISVGYDNMANSLAFSNDGKSLVIGLRGQISIIDLTSNTEKLKLSINQYANIIRFHPKQDQFAVVICEDYRDGEPVILQIRDAHTGEILKSFGDILPKWIYNDRDFLDMAYSPDGKYLILSTQNGQSGTLVFDVQNDYKRIATISQNGSVSFNADSTLAVIGNQVFRVNQFGKPLNGISSDLVNPYLVNLSPDGRYLVTLYQDKVRVFDAASLSKMKVEVSGRSEGYVPSPVVVNGTGMFPIGKILNVLDISGTETVVRDPKPTYSYVTFRGSCYAISEGKTEVTEYVVDESGVCFEPTGKVYKLEKAALYVDREGIYVPLSFISEVIVGPKNDTIYQSDDNILVFNMYTWDELDSKEPEKPNKPTIPVTIPITLAMKINSPWLLTTDDGNLFDDKDHNVTPVTRQGTTLLPIAPIISKLGGKTTWNSTEKKVTITLNKNTIELWIDRKTALVNGVSKALTVPPTSIKGRTMIPVRFVTENLGADVKWYKDSQMLVIYYGGAVENATDLFTFEYKLTLLDPYQKKEDNKTTLEDVVKENQKKHDQVKYNDKDPLDYYGKMIHVGDIVDSGTFDGVVKKINGTKVLVYWNHASFLVDTGKEKETAALFGIKWLSEQWVEAKTVTFSGSGY
ncbi:WD40 repeat protein [Paenibacillus baekrokdamisoli]|nr:stalk domain-containing protein [Paenibacillus baekrokdamisoli]MBB3068347.1 WD40 repeat protein [Paenibacillus baekrokdamisoli]